jgi:hypothetical protein
MACRREEGLMRFRLLLCVIFPLAALNADAQTKSSNAQVGPEVLTQPKSVGADDKSNLEKLRKEREGLTRDREDAAKELDSSDPYSAERAKLRLQLAELLRKINERQQPPVANGPIFDKKEFVDTGSKSIDPLNQAQNLYRTGNFEASLRAFKLVESASLAGEDRAFVQYMIASCLRRLGQMSEATAIYRDVADSREDAFLSECAVWQLSTIRWRKDLEMQLEELRQRRKRDENAPKTK